MSEEKPKVVGYLKRYVKPIKSQNLVGIELGQTLVFEAYQKEPRLLTQEYLRKLESEALPKLEPPRLPELRFSEMDQLFREIEEFTRRIFGRFQKLMGLPSKEE